MWIYVGNGAGLFYISTNMSKTNDREKNYTNSKYVMTETSAMMAIEIMNMVEPNMFESTKAQELDKKGDYTSNIAFKFSKILERSPQEIAEELAERISKHRTFHWYWDRVEAKNGFLNFYLSKSMLLSNLLNQN